MEYKGYIGSIEFSESDDLFYGKVQGINSLIPYEGANESDPNWFLVFMKRSMTTFLHAKKD